MDMDDLWRQRDEALRLVDGCEEEKGGSSSEKGVQGDCPHTTTIRDRPQGVVLCASCGLVVDHIIEDIWGNTLPIRNVKPLSLYRRRHHFSERISQWLVTTRRVPDHVIVSVRSVLGDQTATKTNLRMVLRSLHMANHIEHWIEVHCHVTGRPYPTVNNEIVERIKEQFLRVEVAFEKHRPAHRKCLLSYNYIMCRMLQMYSLQEHLMWFPPLKSRAKLRFLDEVWNAMCATLGLPQLPAPMYNRSLR